MERELTVKVNYVLGNQSAFADAGAAAQQVNQEIGKVGNSFVSRLQSQMSGVGGAAMGLLRGGFGSVAGLGAAGAITGGVVSDMMMGGGGGLRGRGISGMNDAFWGMVLGRDTKEAMTDRASTASGYLTDRYGIQVSGKESELAIRRSTAFTPSTEVDPIKRIEEERSIMLKRQARAYEDYKQLSGGRAAGRATINKIHDEQDDGTLDAKRAREASLAKYDEVTLEAKKRFLAESLARTTELNNLDKQVFEQRKGMMRESRLHFGSMTHAEQQSAKIAADQLRAGKKLMPEQIGMLGSFPELKEMLDAYKLKESKDGGYLDVVAGSKGDMGRAAAMARGMQSEGFKVEPEDMLDAKVKFDATEKLKKMFSEALGDVVTSLTTNTGWLTRMLQGQAWARGKQGDPQ